MTKLTEKSIATLSKELKEYKGSIDSFLRTGALNAFPNNLLDSAMHIVTLDGKRLRPIAVLMSAESYGIEAKDSLSAAGAVEVFHNFTLVHDDIMDQASLRRGVVTVHEKFGTDKAIITGDAMFSHSVGLLIKGNEDKAPTLIEGYIKMAQEVMEGQQFDMEFEDRNNVTIDEYMNMIRLKTSVLFAYAFEAGAILGGASESDRRNFYDFGLFTGLAFQIMDDYLDTFGGKNFGKRIGGDILLDKKTFLLVSALEKATEAEKAEIEQLYLEKDEEKKIYEFQELYKRMGIQEIASKAIDDLHAKSVEAVNALSIPQEYKDRMLELGDLMLRRNK